MNSFYEKYKLYKLNLCDFDTVIPGGQALTYLYQRFFAVGCPCCAMARILIPILLAFTLGYAL